MMLKIFFKIISLFILWRIFLFGISYIGDNFLTYDPSFPYSQDLLAKFNLPRFMYSFANFDGVHYVTIAQKGYIGTGLIQAFFPLYPYLVSFINIIFNNLIISGLLLSNLFAIFSMLALYIYTKNQKIAWKSLLIFLLMPTSFFFGSLYTESLFLFLVILTFISLEKKQIWLATFAIFLAGMTRIVGIFLLPSAILFLLLPNTSIFDLLKNFKKEFFLKEIKTNFITQKKNIAILMLGSLGLIFYMSFLKYEFNDPLYFFHVQSEFGGVREERIITYPQVLYRSIKILMTVSKQEISYFTYLLEFFVGTVGLLLVILSTYKKNISLFVFCLSAFILPTLTGTFSSMPRYILVCFPIYIYLAEMLNQKPKIELLWYIISLLLLIISCTMFIQGYFIA